MPQTGPENCASMRKSGKMPSCGHESAIALRQLAVSSLPMEDFAAGYGGTGDMSAVPASHPDGEILTRREGSVFVIGLNRPAQLNGFTPKMLREPIGRASCRERVCQYV